MLTIELAEVVGAPPAALWQVVTSPHRQHEYVAYAVLGVTPQNECSFGPEYRWKETGVLLGRRYECDVQVLAFEPPHWVCYGTPNLFHVSFELEPAAVGTSLTYRVEFPQTPEKHRDSLAEVCRATIERLKALVESGSH
jgi:uncharacterized protein YndB with AHSA1/START domain